MMIREVGDKRGRGDEGVGEKLQQKSKKILIWEEKSRIISERKVG